MASGNMKDIKRRIKSIESTMQITKAMQLVSSSKFRRAKEKADSAMPFFNTVYETMCEIASEDKFFNSAYVRKTDNSGVTLMIVIAGDRGLAGGYNSNIIKLALSRIEENNDTVLIPIGKKAVEYFSKRNFKILQIFENIGETMTIYKAMDIARLIMDSYDKHKSIEKVELVFTDYVSPLVQEARHMNVIPLDKIAGEPSHSVTRYEPSAGEVFDMLIPKYVAGLIYGAVVCSFASEQASRRNAMENASDNAEEMIDNLSLIYNRARQSAITQEITEIVGGAQAQD